MIAVSQDIPQPLRWLFELGDDGTVIYSSPRPIRGIDCLTDALVGRNFFEEVEGFEDITELQRRFKNFVRGGTAADSFHVRCIGGTGPTNAKIVMTRTFQPGYSSPAGMVMFEVREDDHNDDYDRP